MAAKAGNTGRASRSKGTGGTTANGASKGSIVRGRVVKGSARASGGRPKPY